MISPAIWHQAFAGGLLLFTVILMGKPRLPAMVQHFAFASLCLAGLTWTAGAVRGDDHAMYAAFGTIAFKVVAIPLVLMYSARRSKASMQLRFYLRPAMTYFVVALDLAVAALVTLNFGMPSLFVASALVLMGLSFMILRRDLYSQIIGLMTMENGIAAFGVLAIGGIPLLVEMGIFFVITTGAVIMATLSHQVQEMYATGDTQSLTELTE